MLFNGFQKLTLLDYPGKVACTLFTAGCNFRCPFCHNAALVTHIDNSIGFTEDEVLSFLSKRVGIIEGVCFTGGEPLMHPDLPEFIGRVKALGYSVKLDTNGYLPDRLKTVVDAGLVDHVAMDIKNCREKYSETAGISDLDISRIEESIAFLLSGAVPYEFRTTVVREYHVREDIEKIGSLIKGAEKYYLQCFNDSGDLIKQDLSGYGKEEMKELLKAVLPYIPSAELRGV